jgi:small subunit ribosomal protein S16
MFPHFKDRMPTLRHLPVIERVGIYDPTVNAHGEKLVSLNIERIQHYLSQGIKLNVDVSMLLGE